MCFNICHMGESVDRLFYCSEERAGTNSKQLLTKYKERVTIMKQNNNGIFLR